MIEDLRLVEREVCFPCPQYGEGVQQCKIEKILQAYDGHVWFDVPVIKESPNEPE